MRTLRPGPRTRATGICILLAICTLLPLGACENNSTSPPPPGGTTIDSDTTLDSLVVAAGTTTTVRNGARVTVTGNARIDGTLASQDGPLDLRVGGAALLAGTLRSLHSSPAGMDSAGTPGGTDAGIRMVVGGGLEVDPAAVVESNGPVVVTDDSTTFDRSFDELFEEADTPSGTLPTLVPLPPDHPVFPSPPAVSTPGPARGALAPPVVLRGRWDLSGLRGDRPVVVFRFDGERELELDDFQLDSPPGVDGDSEDNTTDPNDEGQDARGGRGKPGLNLNVWNNGGKITISNTVTLNLADGGNGGSARTSCARAEGGEGGRSGNFRMTARDGIDLSNGSLVVNPGRGGAGGDAEAVAGAAGATGCPGEDGRHSEARGGRGAAEQKRLFVRGQVSGIENITLGLVVAGDGGDATATACDGGDGLPWCDAGRGGDATADGGDGGNASVNAGGFAVVAVGATGGNGGAATATAGDGGHGGDCKFDQAGDGGDGGRPDASGGAGGSAWGDGTSTGGDGGDATSHGGDGGDGGASALAPGNGGAGTLGVALGGLGGTGSVAGSSGLAQRNNGADGTDNRYIPLIFFCFDYAILLDSPSPAPGRYVGPLLDRETGSPVGSMPIELVAGGEFFTQPDPPHIGYIGEVVYLVGEAQLQDGSTPPVAGLEIATLYGQGLSPENPMVVGALGPNGELLGQEFFASVPDNQANPNDPQTISVYFDTPQPIHAIVVHVPQTAFVTFLSVYIIDP